MQTEKRCSPFCQLHSLPKMSGGLVDLGRMPFQRRAKFWLKRMLSARTKRRLKRMTEMARNQLFSGSKGNELETGMKNHSTLATTVDASPAVSQSGLKAGDLVRVRCQSEIEAMLDSWHELKHCAMMPDMWQYCGTIQRVFKVVERFVDERDYRLKKGTGVILLNGLICQGTVDYGRCDRSCFYFWREEWLEKIVG